jgi:glutamine synthetase
MEDTMTARDAIKLAREQHAKFVDLRFTDVPGLWQHFSIPVAELTEELFAEGIFTSDLIRTWIDYKRKNELDPIRLRPHPSEFALYFDI